MYQVHKDFNEYKPVTRAQLDQILDTPVLNLDGLEGISLANDRMEFCYPILEKQVAPYFIGQDAGSSFGGGIRL